MAELAAPTSDHAKTMPIANPAPSGIEIHLKLTGSGFSTGSERARRLGDIETLTINPHTTAVESKVGAVAVGNGGSLLPAAFAVAPVPQSVP